MQAAFTPKAIRGYLPRMQARLLRVLVLCLLCLLPPLHLHRLLRLLRAGRSSPLLHTGLL